MTLKRLVLSILTAIAFALVGLSLLESWSQPQIQSRLELYQTNLLLHAAEWRGDDRGNSQMVTGGLVGANPFETALAQYREAQESAKSTLANKLKDQQNPQVQAIQGPELQATIAQLRGLIAELEVRSGILQVQNGKTEEALKTWATLIEQNQDSSVSPASLEMAQVLQGLWSNPAQLLPDAESRIQQHLDGWFRYRALTQLYQLQERSDELRSLQVSEQAIADRSVQKLAIVIGIPAIGFLIGSLLLFFLLIQWLFFQKKSEEEAPASGPLLLRNANVPWETPWDGETIWQVLIFGFFFVGQILIPRILLPVGFSLLKINPGSLDARGQAFYILTSYLLLAAGGLLVLYFSVEPFFPLPEGWFRLKGRGNWFLWGLGGYFTALPLVILVSLLNQQLWHGQGGSNPILPIALEGRDRIALSIFFITASIAAPFFEEIMFRGFLLPSLTRYLPVWGAIGVSALLFAVAHLNVSEVLPLATLGTVLGFVYTRSRNLLAPMLLHSLWNSGTLLSLFILGSGAS